MSLETVPGNRAQGATGVAAGVLTDGWLSQNHAPDGFTRLCTPSGNPNHLFRRKVDVGFGMDGIH